MDALTIARACADAMWADDVASRALGMELIAVEPGHAVLAMSVTEAMVNGHDLFIDLVNALIGHTIGKLAFQHPGLVQ